MAREFFDSEAVRGQVPLLVGLCGPSSSGKTYSALRLATGIQKIAGGDIYVIDTEANRSKHYADTFKFRHVPFVAPFGALDYLSAVEHCVEKGAKTIVIDSASHLHEGPGGTLEAHEEECQRLAKAWGQSLDKVKMAAWQRPKADLRRFLNSVLQLQANLIFCFRAKEKVKVITGQNPKQLGFMPIAGEEMIFEMTLNVLLYPNSGGVPAWHPDEMGEKAIVKLPGQFRELFAKERPLDEATGEALARWASGGQATTMAAPAQPTTPKTQAGPSPDDLSALKQTLIDGGLGTEELRAKWIVEKVGHTLTSLKALTRSEYETCMALAKEI